MIFRIKGVFKLEEFESGSSRKNHSLGWRINCPGVLKNPEKLPCSWGEFAISRQAKFQAHFPFVDFDYEIEF